jgi:hypothetical protein
MTLNSLSTYGTAFQVKVLSSLLTHKEFLQNINDVLSEEYFDNQAHKWIIGEILNYYEEYHTTPTMEVLKVEMKKVENEVLQLSIKEQLREAYQASSSDLEYIENEFSSFCKNQQLKKALLNSVDLLNSGDFEAIRGLIDNALKAGAEKNAFFTGKPVDTLFKSKDKIEEVVKELPGQLIIKEYAPGQATVNTLRAHIQKCNDLEFKPDLIIIDYVDLLSSKKRTQDRKGEIDDIYVSTKGLAKELQLPIWSVSQVNRAGAKDDVIEGDKAAGSYDKIMITDVAISLSRKKEDKVNGTGRFHFMKNRYGMDGMTFSVVADTSTGHFEVTDHHFDDSDSPHPTQQIEGTNMNTLDRDLLATQFFQLNS